MGKGDANCVHEQVAKADCECPLYRWSSHMQGGSVKNVKSTFFITICAANRRRRNGDYYEKIK